MTRPKPSSPRGRKAADMPAAPPDDAPAPAHRPTGLYALATQADWDTVNTDTDLKVWLEKTGHPAAQLRTPLYVGGAVFVDGLEARGARSILFASVDQWLTKLLNQSPVTRRQPDGVKAVLKLVLAREMDTIRMDLEDRHGKPGTPGTYTGAWPQEDAQ